MPLDAIFLTALTAELNETLPGSRIDKIQQPDRETVLLSLRTQGAGNRRLLLSASPCCCASTSPAGASFR